MASRNSSGFASRVGGLQVIPKMCAYCLRPRATSVSQMIVSTASIWQKNGRWSLRIRDAASAAAIAGLRA